MPVKKHRIKDISKEDRQRLGNLLKNAREKAGITRTEMADRLNCVYASVLNWESRGRYPNDVLVHYSRKTGSEITIS